MDRDGYGVREGQSPVERLLEDCRTLSPAGIERIAAGWERHAAGAAAHTLYHAAERAALHALEASGRTAEWDELRNRVLGLTERGVPLIAWRVEHGAAGHRAEDALMGAALALLAGPGLDGAHRATLLRPMAEALPWLLAASPSP